MRKIAIVALIAALTSCGNAETTTPKTCDSTTVKTDSTKCCADSTKAVDTTKVDTVKTK
jgi:hypothetical protein